MTEQEATDLGTGFATRLATDEGLETICNDACAAFPTMDSKAFGAWARAIVAPFNAPPGNHSTRAQAPDVATPSDAKRETFRQHLQQLNGMLAKRAEFIKMVEQWHKEKPQAMLEE